MANKNKACVIGSPIKHSLSPVIHNYWLKKYDIEGSYEAVEVSPENLKDFLLNLPESDYLGCNITVPHKEKAWEIISNSEIFEDSDSVASQVAKFMKAINTVTINENGRLVVTNTDFLGFARNLIEHAPEFDYNNSICLIIGAGGAARAVAFALASMNVSHMVITNRTIEKSFEIKDLITEKFEFPEDKFDVVEWKNRIDLVKHCNLIVNTTSLGMVGKDELDLSLENLQDNSLVTDIVYNPLETKLLKSAADKGAKAIDGLGMLLHQAAPGFEAWFDKAPEVDKNLREEVLKRL